MSASREDTFLFQAARLVVMLSLGFSLNGSLQAADRRNGHSNWYRCNTHTHTSAFAGSDSNGSLEVAAEWYRTHGYQCLFITDHEHLTSVDELNRKYAEKGEFLLLKGQEIGQALADSSMPLGLRFLHINGLDIPDVIEPVGYPKGASGMTPRQLYQRNVDAIHAAGGLPQVNHPNLQWSVKPEDLLSIDKPFLLEVWNAFPTSNNLGGIDNAGNVSLSTEQLWDRLLTNGQFVWATATDDTHDYINFDRRESTPTPGKAWIVIQAPALTAAAIMKALRQGAFYASTGVRLESYTVSAEGIAMKLAQVPDWNPMLSGSARFQTRFIGANGELLAEVFGDNPRYRFRGNERYVRASIVDSDGRRGWTQPVFRDVRKLPDAAPST